jgi:hypothetical protein
MPRRDDDDKPRRSAIGYNGRRVGGDGSGRGGRGAQGRGRAAARSDNQGRGSHNQSRGGRGRSYHRDNEGTAPRGRGNGSGDGRRSESRFGNRSVVKRSNNNNNNNNNNNQQPQLRVNKPAAKVDPATLQLLRSLQDRIRALESQRPLLNSKGEAVRRFGRQVDRAAGDAPRRRQQQQQQQQRPQTRRQTTGRGLQRTRSPDDRRNSRRGGGRRAEQFGEARRGGVRDRFDWDEGLESREKRRRRDTQGPQDPTNYPPLRVRVRN